MESEFKVLPETLNRIGLYTVRPLTEDMKDCISMQLTTSESLSEDCYIFTDAFQKTGRWPIFSAYPAKELIRKYRHGMKIYRIALAQCNMDRPKWKRQSIDISYKNDKDGISAKITPYDVDRFYETTLWNDITAWEQIILDVPIKDILFSDLFVDMLCHGANSFGFDECRLDYDEMPEDIADDVINMEGIIETVFTLAYEKKEILVPDICRIRNLVRTNMDGKDDKSFVVDAFEDFMTSLFDSLGEPSLSEYFNSNK